MIPDRKLNDVKAKLWKLSQTGLKLLLDYLNWDKYLMVQSIAKTVKEDNAAFTMVFLDGALSRIEWLIRTLWWFIHKDTGSISWVNVKNKKK